MKPETVCCGCGKTIEKAFVYYPWCGHLRNSLEKREFFDTMENEFDYAYFNEKSKYIESIEKRLQLLENELDVIIGR